VTILYIPQTIIIIICLMFFISIIYDWIVKERKYYKLKNKEEKVTKNCTYVRDQLVIQTTRDFTHLSNLTPAEKVYWNDLIAKLNEILPDDKKAE